MLRTNFANKWEVICNVILAESEYLLVLINQSMSQKELPISSYRVELFSDAVIAIVITLMILEARVPEISNVATTGETTAALLSIAPSFVSFALSFVGLAVIWVNHHQFFLQLKHIDTRLLWLNLHLLFWTCIIPVSTSFLARSFQRPQATALYGFNLFMTLLAFTFMREYVNRHEHLFIENLSRSLLRKNHFKNLISAILYLCSIFTGLISTYISIAIFISVLMLYFVPQNILLERRKRKSS